MSAAFTPGPWLNDPLHKGMLGDVSTAGGEIVVAQAQQVPGDNLEQDIRAANARLIAAAPAMLEALGWLESYLRDTPHHNAPAAANARAAIALAKGESA